MSVEEWLLFGALRLDIGRRLKVRFGRIARVGYPAAFGVKRSIERQLRKTDDRLVVAGSLRTNTMPESCR